MHGFGVDRSARFVFPWTRESKDTADSKSYKVQKDVDCNTTNLIYCLLCDKCNVVVYVGETERSLKERLTEHLRDVRNGADKPINKHFSNHTDQDVRVAVLRKMHDDSKVGRLIHEEHWIKLFQAGAMLK